MLALAAFLLGLGAAGQPPASPDPGYGRELPEGSANLDFIIVNRTGQTVTAVAIRPSGEPAAWSDDILVQREVPSGERAAASYTRDVELCRWEVRVTYDNGRQRIWPRIDLCETMRVVLR